MSPRLLVIAAILAADPRPPEPPAPAAAPVAPAAAVPPSGEPAEKPAEPAEGPAITDADLAPFFADGPLARALELFEADHHAEAAQAFAKGGTPQARYLEAQSRLRANDSAGAAAALTGLEAALPEIADRVTYWRAAALEDQSKHREAAAIWAQVPHTSLLYNDAQWNRAQAFVALGDRAAALAALEPVLSVPAPSEITRGDPAADALLLAGKLRAESKDKADRAWARRSFNECWASHPLSRAAAECATRGKALGGDSPSIEDTLRRAEALLEANRNRTALTDLEGLIGKIPEAGPGQGVACRARFALGKAYRKERLYLKAIAALKPVVDRCDDPGIKVKALYILASAASIATPAEGVPLYKQLARDFPDHPYADDALFFAADLQARGGDTEGAQKTLTRLIEHFPKGDFRSEALFKRAWLERRTGDADGALSTLKELEEEYRDGGDPYEHERAVYWRARLLAARGAEDRARAQRLFLALYQNHPSDYYGLLARARLSEVAPRKATDADERITVPDAPPAGFRDAMGPLAKSSHFRAGLLLLRLGLRSAAGDELNSVDRDEIIPATAGSAEPLLLLAEVLDRAGDHRSAHNLMRVLGKSALRKRPGPENVRVWRVAYPKAWRPEVERFAPGAGVPPDLLQALMREESALDPNVISGAGAVGLTQLMIPTANGVARKLKIGKTLSGKDLTEPTLNIRIGATYLGDLLKRFGDSTPLALAAYNAGGGAVKSWLSKRGDLALDEFVEEIPIQETRGYVKRVLRSYGAYRLLYGKPSDRVVALSQRLPTSQ
jgi:soluble lytic murein transglycosylase